jgi:hypothetical protein
MTRQGEERSLQPSGFIASTEIIPSTDVPPRIAILIPGIRTNAEWIDEVTRQERFTDSLKVIKAYGGRISSWHLITRFGVGKIRRKILAQVNATLLEYPDSEVSLICHSLGSSLAADILNEMNYRFKYVIFLGTICHCDHAILIKKSCETFINHRGSYDPWPILAALVRPSHYSPTGTFGFNFGAYVNDIEFDNDHATCTSYEHIKKFVIPVISNGQALGPTQVTKVFDLNRFYYARRFAYCTLLFSIGLPYSHYILVVPLLAFLGVAGFYKWPRR